MRELFELNVKLQDVLSRVIRSHNYALLDWPNHNNTGDHLIWLGEKNVLFNMGYKCLYECNIPDYRRSQLEKLPIDCTIMLHGGGNFGDIYPEYQSFRELVLAENPDRRIVCLPQSIHFKDENKLAESFRKIRRHSDFTLLVRDIASLGTAQQNMDPGRVILCPDSAVSLWPIVQALAEMVGERKKGHLGIIRRDSEATNNSRGRLPADITACDWIDEPLNMRMFSIEEQAICNTLKANSVFITDKDQISFRRMMHGIELLTQGDKIWTDRLHTHLLALMMGKSHTLFDNSYGKNRRFVECWTSNSPLLQFVGASPS